MVVNTTRFPDGLDGLSKKIHDMKLKFGIYSSRCPIRLLFWGIEVTDVFIAAGTLTCAGYPASLEYEDVDAADFAKWGVDCE